MLTSHKKNNYPHHRFRAGISAAELIVVVAIIAIVAGVVGAFQRDIFFFNSITQANLNAQIEGRRAIRIMVKELREATSSSLGSYPLVAAATSTLTFYSDIDGDTLKEQVRYYLQNKKIFKGVIKPSGNPLAYNVANEVTTTALTDVSNDSLTPVFQYFDSSYAGTTAPLTLPINALSVRLIKIQMIVDRDPNRSPTPLTVTSQVTIRNLKDNL